MRRGGWQPTSPRELRPEEGPVNICSGEPATVREAADEFGRRDLLRFGAPADNPVDQPCVIGIRG
jgi:hypothetical protein